MPEGIDFAAFLSQLGSAQFTRLRPAQASALSAYTRLQSSDADIAIELPTGAGKSLIALLIGEACRRSGNRVAILTGNKTLARQMEREATSLGVPAIRMEGPGRDIPPQAKRAYQRGQQIAVMNYWVYFNQNPVIDPADLLFIDDAHLAEHCLHSLHSVEINRHSHNSLFEALVTELSSRFPEYSVLQDALDSDSQHNTPTELMSFLDHSAVADRIREIVDTSTVIQNDTDLRFRWTRLRERIREANLYLSTQSLWLRPYVYPLTTNRHYAEASRRIYMSATVGDPADLARRLGTHPIKKLSLPETASAVTQGRRMIVMNRIEDEDIPSRLQAAILAALAVHPKSVWLCSSVAEATRFQNVVAQWLNGNGFVGHPTWLLSSLGDEIDEFKASATGHLFVGGRFDGMDFKADECRLVVLATLPRAINLQEEFFTAYLRDSGFMLRRLNQRIIQALGRCNRAEDDFGVYILADQRFATHFGRESNRRGIPSNIVAEVDYAENASTIPESELASRVTAFLNADFVAFDAEIAECAASVPPEAATEDDAAGQMANNEVVGWTALFDGQDYNTAATHFERSANEASRSQLRELSGFYRWCQGKALYLSGEQHNVVARNTAPDILEQAIECGARSAWFNRLRSSLNRYRARSGGPTRALPTDYPFVVVHSFDELLERLGPRGTRFQNWVNQATADLNSTSHAAFQNGLRNLGSALGYGTASPRYGASTDCRWKGIFGNTKEVVTFEAKIEHEPSGTITPTAVGQAHNQLTRAKTEYVPFGYSVRGTIVTHLEALDAASVSSLGEIRVVRKDAIQALWTKLVQIISEYRDNWDLNDVAARLAAADEIVPKLPPAAWLTRALTVDARWITAAEILREWP